MRWLMQYLRQLFCDHVLQQTGEGIWKRSDSDGNSSNGTHTVLTCSRCGYQVINEVTLEDYWNVD